jgi:hypothetical protein
MADIYIKAQWTNEGFNQVFEELMKNDITYVEAYRQAELKHVELFGALRYSNYDSFRSCRHKLLFK